MQRLIGIVLLTCLVGHAMGQKFRRDFKMEDAGLKKTKLWEQGAPQANGNESADQPGVYIMLPKGKPAETGVVVCPGGGYGFLAFDHEGYQVGKYLNEIGVAAFVLQYRIAPKYRDPCPRLDAQRAIRFARSKASEFGIKPDRIGVWGFSAGGHLASTVGTQFDAGDKDASDPIDRVSCRPDFMILSYPVITFDGPYAHRGSRNNLLGKEPDQKKDLLYSNQTRVTKDTPPTFLMHTAADTGVPPENSILFFTALRAHKIPCEMHIFEHGPHGIGMNSDDPVLKTWPDRLTAWLKHRKLVP